jgi:hypothetical protein
VSVCSLAFAASVEASQIGIYLSAPAAQTSTVTFSSGGGLTTETFDNKSGTFTTYNSIIGTYVGTFKVQGSDQYGGANKTNYFTFGAQTGTSTPVTLNLNTQANYFGFWWSAGDANNGITLYSAGTALAHFTTADIKNLLSGPSVTAIDGSTYLSKSYFCNPNGTNQNCPEPYAFIHLIATGLSFDRIVFDNSKTSSTGFESDNHTVAYGTVVIPTTFVSVENLTLFTPEPGTWALLGTGLVLVAARRRQRS